MLYPNDIESKLGFDFIRAEVSRLCSSRMGKDAVQAMSFSSDYNTVLRLLRQTSEMLSLIRSASDLPGANVYDVVPYLNEIKASGSFMAADRLNALGKMLASISEVRNFFSRSDEDGVTPLYPELKKEFEGLVSFPSIEREIDRCVNKFGEIKDNASPELSEIRRSISAANGSIARAMRRVLDRAAAEGVVDKDAAPTMRDGRMVLPVSAAMKRSINGIIHDESATGKTVFIEPAEVVEAGNHLRELQMQERREIVRILISIANLIRPDIELIEEGCLSIGYLDFIKAKAMFANNVDASLPRIEKKPEIDWFNAFHPVLYLTLKQQDRKVVPLNLHLEGERRFLIISGPNAGGKSVALKTVGIVQYMMQCGMLPTLYDNSHMGIFENILVDLGDEQSMENDLSTYSSHLRNMKMFLRNSGPSTLVLADEMGSGTEPQIGGALAQSILYRLGESGCFGVVTTHYQNLKTFADETSGFVNGAMLYDRQHLRPTFQLSVGNPGSSFAIEIARNIGLPAEVIDMAKELVGSDYVNSDKYLLDIARDRKYWSNKRQSIKEKEQHLDKLLEKYEDTASDLKQKRAEILKDAREEAREILKTANARLEKAIRDIKNAEAEKERTRQIRRELEDYKESLKEPAEEKSVPEALKPLKHKSKKSREESSKKNKPIAEKPELSAGDWVKMDGSGSAGQIISIQGKKAEVAFGPLRTTVDLSRLSTTQKPKQSAASQTLTVSSQTSEDSRRRQLNFKNEIDVRGMRADEAIQAVTYFLDDAVQFSASKVRILHGTGHGILKTLIREQLRVNPNVTSYHDEDVRFGGAGITIVNLS
ncbi:MAG: Smr/MutS family protein [Muribaculaceae bacterium]|nr:Smr/MutS family protein [Muribaculaceae bacterium]